MVDTPQKAAIEAAHRLGDYLDNYMQMAQLDKETIHCIGRKNREIPLLSADLQTLIDFAKKSTLRDNQGCAVMKVEEVTWQELAERLGYSEPNWIVERLADDFPHGLVIKEKV